MSRLMWAWLSLVLMLAGHAALCPGQATLRNAGLDGLDGFPLPGDSRALPGNHAWVHRGIGEIQSPTWWFPFWRQGAVDGDPSRDYRRPEFKVTALVDPWLAPPRIDDGSHSLQFFGSHGAVDAGIYQQVTATPGVRYRFGARGHCWSSCEDNQYVSGECPDWDAGHAVLRCGIDPTGGTDAFAPAVVWGAGASIHDAFDDIPAVAARARDATITVFLRGSFVWSYKHNNVFIDSAWLESER